MFHKSLYGILFVQMVLYSLFLSNYTSFQLTFQSLVSTSRAGRIVVYSYQLHFLLSGLFGTVMSFQRSSNLVRVFLHEGYDFFSGSFPVRHLSALHFYDFLADFNFLHTVYILKLFSTVFQPLSVLVIFFS